MAKPTVSQVKAEIDGHIDICHERYISIDKRLARLEGGAVMGLTGVIGLLISIILILLDK